MSIMKQDELEWVEYQEIMEDVIERSGLDKAIFYDLRGNHDNFGVPTVGGSYDFFSKYSINGQLGRTGNVNSVTLENGKRRHLFVGVDSTAAVGVRGPTNVFGHPTDQLLSELDSELSQWDSQTDKYVTKISFGHFPLSFSAKSQSKRSLQDIFIRHSISAYLCGHLHTKFGTNLKRHHQLSPSSTLFNGLFQLNAHRLDSQNISSCPDQSPPIKGFWEWEMGDWRFNRAMRILAIDRGHVSIVDLDLKSGVKKTIIIPTFPLDSRFMLPTSSHSCDSSPISYQTIRALVFSVSRIVSVVVKIYDTRPGEHLMVLESYMQKREDNSSRGDLYFASWNYEAFEDPSPERYWLQIEAMDITGRVTFSELRPFSINGISAKLSWTWKEFFVMGVQWEGLYYPLLWCVLGFLFCCLIVSRVLKTSNRGRFTYQNFTTKKSILNFISWYLLQLSKDTLLWLGAIIYLLYLILFPWFWGQVFTEGSERGYMTYKGWVLNSARGQEKLDFLGYPDVMVIAIPHLVSVVLPAILCIGALACEAERYHANLMSYSTKKNDDKDCLGDNQRSKLQVGKRWLRNAGLVMYAAVLWKHLMRCRFLMKAYQMNPILHFPVYAFYIPLMLAYSAYTTRRAG
uniref:Calcineurin-like phosphoesterase domain-containing protein n=1 Tax=Kalanchoe fedtschenkoi TaxID=63787 RepID=A0A7N0TYX7_KALFE